MIHILGISLVIGAFSLVIALGAVDTAFKRGQISYEKREKISSILFVTLVILVIGGMWLPFINEMLNR